MRGLETAISMWKADQSLGVIEYIQVCGFTIPSVFMQSLPWPCLNQVQHVSRTDWMIIVKHMKRNGWWGDVEQTRKHLETSSDYFLSSTDIYGTELEWCPSPGQVKRTFACSDVRIVRVCLTLNLIVARTLASDACK